MPRCLQFFSSPSSTKFLFNYSELYHDITFAIIFLKTRIDLTKIEQVRDETNELSKITPVKAKMVAIVRLSLPYSTPIQSKVTVKIVKQTQIRTVS